MKRSLASIGIIVGTALLLVSSSDAPPKPVNAAPLVVATGEPDTRIREEAKVKPADGSSPLTVSAPSPAGAEVLSIDELNRQTTPPPGVSKESYQRGELRGLSISEQYDVAAQQQAGQKPQEPQPLSELEFLRFQLDHTRGKLAERESKIQHLEEQVSNLQEQLQQFSKREPFSPSQPAQPPLRSVPKAAPVSYYSQGSRDGGSCSSSGGIFKGRFGRRR